MKEMAVNRDVLRDVIRGMPKAELHIHIEGSLEPEMIFALAKRNNIRIPFETVDDIRSAYAFSNLQSFLDIYYAGAAVLISEQDFFDLAAAYLARAHADNVVHAEIFFDPQTHTSRGIDLGVVIAGLVGACEQARDKYGMSTALIPCFLRHLSEDDAIETFEKLLPYRSQFIGAGLDSSEVGNPPEKFKEVFRRCRDAGLHVVAHAGEEGPPAYIWGAIETLKAERIDHGVRSVEDPRLVAMLATSQIPLTMCPLSNVRLRVFENMKLHSLPTLLEQGVCATVHSDDPAYFGGYINDNFLAVFDAFPNLGAAHAFRLALNSFNASFADAAAKERWKDHLVAFFEQQGYKPAQSSQFG